MPTLVRVPLTAPELVVLGGLTGVLVLVGAAGARSDPNNWDSLTYHLPRVAQWLQAGDLGHFATSNIRQLDQPPLSSYAIAHVVAVTDTDRLAFLVQWSALVGCCVLASRIVAQLGGDRRTQVVTAVICGTAPMALLQGSSTQNDLVMAFWFLASCSVALESRTSPARRVLPLLAVLAALALLTKGTAVALLPATGLFAAWSYRSSWRSAVPAAARGALVAGILIAPHYARNMATFDGIVAPETASMQSVDGLGARSTVSTLMRNTAIELATPWPVSNARLLEQPLQRAHDAFGIDPSEPGWSFASEPFRVASQWAHEDAAGSPAHFLLAVFALGVVAADRRLRSRAGPAAVFAVAGYLLMAVLFLWQPWGARLLVPLIALTSVPVAMMLGYRARRLMWVVPALLLALSVPVVVSNERRPLSGSSYFPDAPELTDHYRNVVREAARGCDDVGLKLGGDTREYPLWKFAPEGVALRHVDVVTSSARLEQGHRPCSVIVEGAEGRLTVLAPV